MPFFPCPLLDPISALRIRICLDCSHILLQVPSRPRATLASFCILHVQLRHFANFTIRIFRVINPHVVTSCWMGTNDVFLTPGIFRQRSLSSRNVLSHLEGDASSLFNPPVKCLHTSIILPPLHHAQGHPWQSNCRSKKIPNLKSKNLAEMISVKFSCDKLDVRKFIDKMPFLDAI